MTITFPQFQAAQIRVARPTGQLNEITRFYEEGLGLKRVGEFSEHNGYSGVMFGMPGTQYHLEFTEETDASAPAPVPHGDSLLVFYMPHQQEVIRISTKLKQMGFKEKEPENPYWKEKGVTIEDPDGWRIVLMNTSGI
ncbi:VOC family protein [Bacillus sp. ISL-51]|uniref:VOC family protein n=1 Tax=Bacteria TaxID=2 RepID=UPI001BE9FA51|nr:MULTISPECIES: VOC family protein [Bacteria]MBT2574999.1 VOC family protein [Bacillus sp. ISL-51]MBT2634242.1 VOC family protein [Bacillus sp. ISL-26]MBT2713808.1 VOC family protein [Pseudomonas sp. ISL-88]